MSVEHKAINKAITPKEARRRHFEEVVPDEVYEVINQLLVEKYSASIKVLQEEVIDRAIKMMRLNEKTSVSEKDFFAEHWLDVEPVYEAHGWLVSFYKPEFDNGSFRPYWLFSVPSSMLS